MLQSCLVLILIGLIMSPLLLLLVGAMGYDKVDDGKYFDLGLAFTRKVGIIGYGKTRTERSVRRLAGGRQPLQHHYETNSYWRCW
mgnify:CR=1 FL=1